MKLKNTIKTWRLKALLIDPSKTRLVIETADVGSSAAQQLTHNEFANAEQASSFVDVSRSNVAIPEMQSELAEAEQTSSSIDESPILLAIQDFQSSVTYYADPLEEQGKGWFSLHWLGQALTNVFSTFS